jgi:lipoprotein-releasing system ATP-binding protein
MSVAVSARGLVKTYNDGSKVVEVLRGLDLEVEAGELVAVVGPSGSGKSTLLHLLGALDHADSGEVRVGGVDLGALDAAGQADFRRRCLGFVLQFHELLPDFTALENVAMPGRITGWSKRRALERGGELLAEAGLTGKEGRYPSQLSGGERQRVALCRALCLEPALLLADEPTGNLDPQSGERMFELLLALRRRHGTTGVLVTHNPAIAARCARVLALEQGRLEPWVGTLSGS